MGKLVGRQREERAVRDVLDAGGTVVLAGPAGIGKSALARRVLQDRPHVEGGGLALLADRRYVALERAVRRPLQGEPEAVAEALLTELRERTLLIEDIHWTDDATNQVLGLIVGHAPVLVTTRPEGLGDSQRQLIDRARLVEVGPLPAGQARRLARLRHPGLHPDAVDALVASADGSPLLLETLASEAQLSPTLTAAVAARVAGLTDADRAALGRAALLGRPASQEEVGLATARDLDGLLLWRDGGVEVAHSLISGAVVELMEAPHRQRLHADLADVLPDDEAAAHELAAGRTERAYARARAAAGSATTASDRAALLLVAAQAASGDRAHVNRCWLDAADALVDAGRWTEAIAACERLEGAEPAIRAEEALHRGRAQYMAGDVTVARTTIEAGISVVGDSSPGLGARLALERAYLAVRHDTSGRVAAARAALEAAEGSGHDVLRARATLGAALLYESQPGWEEILQAVADEAFAGGDVELSCTAAYHLSSGLGFAGRIGEGTTLAERQAERAAQWGLASWVAHFDATVLINRALTGDDPEGLWRAASEFLATHPVFRNRFHAHTAMVLALSDLGRVDEARRHVAVAAADARSAEAELFAAISAAEVAWLEGDVATARSAVEAARRHRDTWFGMRFSAELSALHLAVEEDEEFEVCLPSVVLPNFWAGLHDLAGLQAWQAGDTQTALAELDRATAAWQAVSMSRFAVRSAISAATLAQRSGRRDAAARRAAAVEMARRARHGGILARIGASRTDGLSPREESVMLLVAEGRTTGEVAEMLGISAATVDSHVRSARRKLGAGSRREAALQVAAAR